MLTIRAIWSRRGRSLTLFLSGTLVVAGCFGSVAYARLSDISPAVASALLLLGVVALASQAASSVDLRRGEIGLAQLRGRTGPRLLWSAVAEPVVILLVATAAGIGLGWLVTDAVAARWLAAGVTFSPGWPEWAAAGVVFAVGVLVVVMASWRTTYETMLDKLVGQRRPRRARTGLLFLQVCVLVGAIVTIYQARQAGPRHIDWVSLLSPALLGLACGLVALWLMRVLAALAAKTRAGNRLNWFVTTRRLFRRADSAAVLPVMIAAAVLAAVAANAWVAADAWRQDTAKLAVGAPISYPVRSGALSAYTASRYADPSGRWLMSAAAFPDPTGGSYRRVFVDPSRWQQVVGDFYAGTAAGMIAHRLAAFPQSAALQTVTGDSVSMVASKDRIFTKKHDGVPVERYRARAAVSIFYVDDKGVLASVDLPPHGHDNQSPAGPGLVRSTARLTDCHRGCVLTELQFTGAAPQRSPMSITELRFAGQNLLGSGSLAPAIHPDTGVHVQRADGALRIWTDAFFSFYGYGSTGQIGTWPLNRPVAALTTEQPKLDKVGGKESVYGIDGSEQPVSVVGTVPVLPFVGSQGALIDIRQALVGEGTTASGAHVVVLARADTPASVRQRLLATGVVGTPTTYQAALLKSRQQTTAQGVRLYLFIALFAAVLALLTAIAAAADQIGGRRQEAASLRSVGLSARGISRSYRREALALAVAVAAASLAAGWFACRALLGALPLVDAGRFGLALDTAPRFVLIVPLAVGAGVVVAVVVAIAFRRIGRTSAPASLRQDLQ